MFLEQIDLEFRGSLRNNGGGYVNHAFTFYVLGPVDHARHGDPGPTGQVRAAECHSKELPQEHTWNRSTGLSVALLQVTCLVILTSRLDVAFQHPGEKMKICCSCGVFI